MDNQLDTQLRHSIEIDDFDSGLAAIEGGCNPNIANRSGNTLMARAAFCGNVEVARKLRSIGADLNSTDRLGLSPLHLAVQERRIEVIRILLDSGALVDPQDRHGNTPLSRAVFQFKNDDTSKAIIDLLIKSGADLDKSNKHGSTPRKLAEIMENGPLL